MGWEFGVVDGKMEFCTCFFRDAGFVWAVPMALFLLCISYLLLRNWWGGLVSDERVVLWVRVLNFVLSPGGRFVDTIMLFFFLNEITEIC